MCLFNNQYDVEFCKILDNEFFVLYYCKVETGYDKKGAKCVLEARHSINPAQLCCVG